MSESYSKSTQVAIFANQRTEIHGYQSGTPVNSDVNVNFGSATAYSTFTGIRNSSWRRQIRSGQNATTTAGGTQHVHKPDFVSIGYTTLDKTRGGIPFTREISGLLPLWTFASEVPASGSVVTSVRNRVLRKFYSRAKDVQSSVELGQDLGEWKETLHGFQKPFDSLRNLINGHYSRLTKAKKRYKDNRSLRKALADSYLEFVFGWNPLALDVADAYAGLVTRSRMTDVAPVSSSASEFASATTTQGNIGGVTTVVSRSLNRSKYSERLKGAIHTRVGANGLIPLMDVFQLSTVENFVTTAWDLLPYSFLVDYFTNAGDIIESYCYSSSNIAWHCLTTRTVNEKLYSLAENGTAWFDPATETLVEKHYYGGNAISRCTIFTRTVPSLSSLIPTLQFSLPHSKKVWGNITALVLGGSFGKLVPFFK